jgi:hypothetical protein
MRLIRACRFHELTDLRKTVLAKPAFALAALNCDAIGLHLVRADSLVGAFVAEYPQFHWRGEAGEQVWVQHDNPPKRRAEIPLMRIEHRRDAPACHNPAVNLGPTGRYKSATASCGEVVNIRRL